eukprot:CAMPEP_0196593322 /NCGR_PEP_ID=MMETSP1081-20130531/75322_1 /TAXON_ID=36882 /ORGANISM="Pyramimonas amylifera, Strain CCMP720" /LENGTH=586 /DNA_ID=CAMNT_0041917273 /DNA_START=84 /DNA_END=1841 /DNA_ORIENTATION=-
MTSSRNIRNTNVANYKCIVFAQFFIAHVSLCVVLAEQTVLKEFVVNPAARKYDLKNWRAPFMGRKRLLSEDLENEDVINDEEELESESTLNNKDSVQSKLLELKRKRVKLVGQLEAAKQRVAALAIERESVPKNASEDPRSDSSWGAGFSKLLQSTLGGTTEAPDAAVAKSTTGSGLEIPSLFRRPPPEHCMGALQPWDPFRAPTPDQTPYKGDAEPSLQGGEKSVGGASLELDGAGPTRPSDEDFRRHLLANSRDAHHRGVNTSTISAVAHTRHVLRAREVGPALWQQQHRRLPRMGRSLLARGGAPLVTRPLAIRCAAAARTRKSIRPPEVGLAACLRREDTFCPHPKDQVEEAARGLASMNFINPRVKCLTVHSDGCSSFANNPETQPLRRQASLKPPPILREVPRQFHTCALVGNGPGVRRVLNGAAIDRHDAVFRFNALRHEQDAPFTGVKSTFRIFNRKRLTTLGRLRFAPAEGEHWLFWNYMGIPLMGRMKALNPNIHLFSPDVIRYTMNGYFALKRDMIRLGMGKFGCPTNVNSGIHAIFLAFQMCEHVNLFGFSFSMHMLNERSDSISPRMSRFHDW